MLDLGFKMSSQIFTATTGKATWSINVPNIIYYEREREVYVVQCKAELLSKRGLNSMNFIESHCPLIMNRLIMLRYTNVSVTTN